MHPIGLPMPALCLSNVLLYTFPTVHMQCSNTWMLSTYMRKKSELEKYAQKRYIKRRKKSFVTGEI